MPAPAERIRRDWRMVLKYQSVQWWKNKCKSLTRVREGHLQYHCRIGASTDNATEAGERPVCRFFYPRFGGGRGESGGSGRSARAVRYRLPPCFQGHSLSPLLILPLLNFHLANQRTESSRHTQFVPLQRIISSNRTLCVIDIMNMVSTCIHRRC